MRSDSKLERVAARQVSTERGERAEPDVALWMVIQSLMDIVGYLLSTLTPQPAVRSLNETNNEGKRERMGYVRKS